MGDTTIVEKCITHGPWGGSKGHDWIYMPEGYIREIIIVYGEVIHGLKFKSYVSTAGIQSSFFGGKGGKIRGKIHIDFPHEYLTAISGSIGSYEGSEVLMSLWIGTNKACYGPYGTDGKDTSFVCCNKGSVIVGFHGRDSKYINAIGVCLMPKLLALDRNSSCEIKSRHEKCWRVSRMEMPREAGPWGARGGKPWDDGVFSNVKQVQVHVGEDSKVINAIRCTYVKMDGKSILSRSHGDTDADIIKEVNLDSTDEYLTGISGYYGPIKGGCYKGLEGITSITFHTNKGIHGPYGEESGEGYVYFTSTASLGKVLGFHGRNGEFLTAIGVHMEYF